MNIAAIAPRPKQASCPWFSFALALCALFIFAPSLPADDQPAERHYLYVAVPGVRDYLEYGGHGIVVFDVDDAHRFVRRIPTAGLSETGKPLNVKGICGCAETGRIYISTLKQLMCLDVATDEILWERKYDAGCDRMSITPDGRTIYLPSLEGPLWYVVDAATGDVRREIVPNSGAHNTICGLSGKYAYLAGLRSPLLSVVGTGDGSVRTIGPFSASVRPFTVDGRETRCYVNVNELLGFEIGDLASGKKLHSVTVAGFEKGPVKRHGCPSHGIGLAPDEKEIWVTDAHNQRLHIFDNTRNPPKQLESVKLRDEPGWITFSLDGRYAYPSTGDVIEAVSRNVVAHLTDEHQRAVQSEKMIEVHRQGDKVLRLGDQFGLGRVVGP
jgi:DNA-binding beta-propeller fold protein YncE